jgi:hypothetical protein
LGFTGTTFGGTLTIDVTAGTATGIDVSFQGLSPFNTILVSDPIGTISWIVGAGNLSNNRLFLSFVTEPTPGSLVGFTGGTIFTGDVFVFPGGVTAYTITGGSITAPTGVPDAGSTLPLLGLASLGLVALRRKLGC